MEGIIIFLILCLGMFCASYLSGYFPIYITSKLHSSNAVSIFGAGLMIGTSLLIIIPEGVNAMYHASLSHVKTYATNLNEGNELVSELEYGKIGNAKIHH